jgi:tetratricopeptide (TPR) repeat protein
MAKKRINLKNYIVFLILVMAGVLPYFYSREIYGFYMKVYYETILGQSMEEQLRAAEKLYEEHEYTRLKNYLKDRVVAYPENNEFKKLDGLALIKLGNPRKGTDMIITASDGGQMPEKLLEETVNSLGEQKMYRDIIIVFKKNEAGRNPNLLYWYGIALYETGDYTRALANLKRAVDGGRTDYRAYLYLGKAYYRTGDARAALPCLERSSDMIGDDPEAAMALAQTLRKLGRYAEAEKTMRSVR